MLSQFSIQYFKSSFNLSMYDLSMNDVFMQIRKLLVPMLFLALFISTGASASYEVKVKGFSNPEMHASLKFGGQPPKSIDGFYQYTIDKFELKIGKNNHAVSKHNDTSLFASVKNFKELDDSLSTASYLVLIWDLSAHQALSEGFKCIRKHADWWGLWWLKAPFKDCVAKVYNAFAYHQTHEIEITEDLRKAVKDEHLALRLEIILINNELAELIIDAKFTFYDLSLLSPEKKTVSAYTKAQSRVVFGLATYDYLVEDTIFSKTFYNLALIKNLIKNLRDIKSKTGKNYITYREGPVFELFKAFSSKDCKNKLSQKVIDNINNSSRLISAVNDYANHGCKFNLFSLTEGNKSNNPTPIEFNDSHTNPEISEYQPYVFCDGYNCMINLSKTHKYNLMDYYQASIRMESGISRLYHYLHRDSDKLWDVNARLCENTCTFPIYDLDRFNDILDELLSQARSDELYSGWAIVEIVR